MSMTEEQVWVQAYAACAAAGVGSVRAEAVVREWRKRYGEAAGGGWTTSFICVDTPPDSATVMSVDDLSVGLRIKMGVGHRAGVNLSSIDATRLRDWLTAWVERHGEQA